MSTTTKLNGKQLLHKFKSPIKIVAPMVDQSELAWRQISRQYGATLCYTPMLHAKLFATSEKYRRDMWSHLDGQESDRPLIVQICGNDPKYILETAKLVQDRCDAVDLNLGCPQGIAKKGHYGSFLMEEWELIHDIIKTLHDNLNVPVTAKIRVFPEQEKTLKYAKMIVEAGAQILTVHGRLREQKGQKTGLANWDIIKYLRDNISDEVPIFANGNILYAEDINRCLEYTGCQGIMSAEGNLFNPGIFSDEPARQFPRVDVILREYFDIVKALPVDSSRASRHAMKSHFFKILRSFLSKHTDIRDKISHMNVGKNTIEEWETEVVRPVEEIVSQLVKDNAELSTGKIVKGPLESWGGSYWSVPYWYCQPYFRPVNGITSEQKVHNETLKRKLNTELSDEYKSSTVDSALNVINDIVVPSFVTTPLKDKELAAPLAKIVQELQLFKHPEGGYYKETDRSPFTMLDQSQHTRNYSTLIYYLLTPHCQRGRFHKNKNRIIHTLHRGRGQYVLIYPNGYVHSFKVGYNASAGEVSQWVVPGGVYKASFPLENEELCDSLLISEVVVPGFDFEDHQFMTGGFDELLTILNGDKRLADKLSFLL